LLLHDDGAGHAGLAMSGDQAGEIEGARLGEAPEDFARLLRFEPPRIRLLVAHVGVGLHRLHVMEIVLQGGQDEFMLDPSIVAQQEAHLLACPHPQPVGLEEHAAVLLAHHHLNDANRTGSVAGLAVGRFPGAAMRMRGCDPCQANGDDCRELPEARRS
jgi:hypothetical protein